MKRIISDEKKGIYLLPWTGSNSTDFSGAHVSYSDIDRVNIDMDLLDDDGDDDDLLFFFDGVPASPVISSSSSLSSSSSVDRVTPATALS
jgi:hypothetical protein